MLARCCLLGNCGIFLVLIVRWYLQRAGFRFVRVRALSASAECGGASHRVVRLHFQVPFFSALGSLFLWVSVSMCVYVWVIVNCCRDVHEWTQLHCRFSRFSFRNRRFRRHDRFSSRRLSYMNLGLGCSLLFPQHSLGREFGVNLSLF